MNSFSCGRCRGQLARSGRFCPYCGHRHDIPARHSQPELPPYQRKKRRLLGSARCGMFHHELMTHMYGFRFCPECGQMLSGMRPQAEPT